MTSHAKEDSALDWADRISRAFTCKEEKELFLTGFFWFEVEKNDSGDVLQFIGVCHSLEEVVLIILFLPVFQLPLRTTTPL